MRTHALADTNIYTLIILLTVEHDERYSR